MSIMNINSPTYTLSATTSSSAVTLTDPDVLCESIIVSVVGSGNVFIVSGVAQPTAVFPTSATAPLNGQVVPAGVTMTLTKNVGDKFISGITDASTAKVYIAVGSGE